MLKDWKKMPFGKKINQTIYFHRNALPFLPIALKKMLIRFELKQEYNGFNVIKINQKTQQLSLLWYEDFDSTPFPALLISKSIDLHSTELLSSRRYTSNNPPILHRKELLLPPNHPDIPRFASLTAQLDKAGLFYDSRKIGFKQAWAKRLKEAGYQVIDHQLVKRDMAEIIVEKDSTTIERHKTALTRYALSKPMQTLEKYNFLTGQYSVFDYGCGKGSDIDILRKNNVQVQGWDPYFCPDKPLHTADIVNLGFVVNVIEAPDQRAEALINAYGLCTQFLSVAVMLGKQSPDRGHLYQDGVLTRRNTFQKYFSQNEFREYLRDVLDEEPVAVGSGIFFVFKDKEAEQAFLEQRYRHQGRANRLINVLPKTTQKEQQRLFYAEHQMLLDTLWLCCLELGRPPVEEEFSEADKIIVLFSTWRRGLSFLQRFHGDAILKQAFDKRREDLSIYFAMRLFEQKRNYKTLPEALRRDIKAFFNHYKGAQAAGQSLLFSTGDSATIRQACQQSTHQGLGYLDDKGSLILHTSLVSELPAVLRVYIACATQLYGDIVSADLLKIHAKSGKLSLMLFDDFEQYALPRMIERIKIRLFDQHIDFYNYDGEIFVPPYLYLKSRFINDDYPHYTQQYAFDQALQAIESMDLSGHGMSPTAFEHALKMHGLKVDGFQLSPSAEIPHIDDPCGRYHRFRDFIECGATQTKTQQPNLPKQVASYHALQKLAREVIDPIMDYFGGIKLSYGFCSRKLATQIPAHIAPSLDQHACHELNTRGNIICKRLGAACDFIVPDESMLEVAQWIVEHTPFDRLYFYGDNQPLHISIGAENSQAIALMKRSATTGRQYPVMVSIEKFLKLSYPTK